MNLNDNGRKTIMVVFLSIFSLFVMGIFVYLIPTAKVSDIVASQLLGLTLSALILMHFAFNGVPTELNIVWEKFKLILRPNGSNLSGNNVSNGKPFFGIDPTKSKMSPDARAIKDAANEIVKEGRTAGNLQKALNIIETNYEIVKDCWVILLNKVRLLCYLGRSVQAKKYLEEVKTMFTSNKSFMSDIRESQKFLSCCYEIEAWFSELKLNYNAPNLKDLAKDSNFKRQKQLLEKGLSYNPQNHAILMSLFFVAVIQQNKKEAIKSLNQAIILNTQLVYETMKDVKNETPRLLETARKLDRDIKETIDEIMLNNNPSKLHLALVRGTTWIVSILFMIVGIFSFLMLVDNTSNLLNIIKINSTKDRRGTNLGKARLLTEIAGGGTNLGRARFLINKINSEFDLPNMPKSMVIEICGTNLGNQKASSKANNGKIFNIKINEKLGTNLG